MKCIESKREFSLVQNIAYFRLKDNFFVYRQSVKCNNNEVKNIYGVSKRNPETFLTPFSQTKHIEQNKLDVVFVKNEFFDEYAKTGFGLKEYNKLRDLFLTPEQIFKIYSSEKTKNEFSPILYDNASEKFYGLNKNWLTHLVRYNGGCYHITNKHYNLQSVLEYLESRDDVFIASGGIDNIPYYNCEDGENKYINFYVLIKPEQADSVEKLTCLDSIPEEILPISKFRVD